MTTALKVVTYSNLHRSNRFVTRNTSDNEYRPRMAQLLRNENGICGCVPYVTRDLNHVLMNSTFLISSKNDKKMALLDRSEVLLGSRVGIGGFSEVYEIIGIKLNPQISKQLSRLQQMKRHELQVSCIDETTGAYRYAIKQLKKELLTKRGEQDFLRAASDLVVEAHYMEALDHPNLLSLRGLPLNGIHAFSNGRFDSYFIICDRLDCTLDQKTKGLAKEDISLKERCQWALDLAKVLEYLHSKRVVFRDLKPQNMGFTTDGKLKLFDFGLCRELPRDIDGQEDMHATYIMSGKGTRRYMAPETVLERPYNCKADVFGWSILAWEMLTGQSAFRRYSIQEHGQRVCVNHERPPVNKIPIEIRGLLQRSWEPDVTGRLTSAQVVLWLSRLVLKTCELPVHRLTASGRLSTRSPTTVVVDYSKSLQCDVGVQSTKIYEPSTTDRQKLYADSGHHFRHPKRKYDDLQCTQYPPCVKQKRPALHRSMLRCNEGNNLQTCT